MMSPLYEVEVIRGLKDTRECHSSAKGRTYLFRVRNTSPMTYNLHILSELPLRADQKPFYIRSWEEEYVFRG